MRCYVVDTSAWIDYLRGTQRGKRVRETIRPPGKFVEVVTPTVVFAELKRHYVQSKQGGFEMDVDNVRSLSESIPQLDEKTAIRAGELRAERKNKELSMVDCILIAVAEGCGGKVLSLDEDFKGRPEAVYIGGKKEQP